MSIYRADLTITNTHPQCRHRSQRPNPASTTTLNSQQYISNSTTSPSVVNRHRHPQHSSNHNHQPSHPALSIDETAGLWWLLLSLSLAWMTMVSTPTSSFPMDDDVSTQVRILYFYFYFNFLLLYLLLYPTFFDGPSPACPAQLLKMPEIWLPCAKSSCDSSRSEH